MDVPPIHPASGASGASGDRQMAPGSDLPFAAGQRFFARVIQTNGAGQAVLDLGGQRLLTAVPIAVSPGQVLHVAIRSLGATVELDLEAPPVEFSERAYALAAVRQARAAAAGGRVTAAEIETLLRALDTKGWGAHEGLGPEPRGQLARLLHPLPLGRDGAALVETLRARLLDSGVQFEQRAAATQTRPGAALPDALRGDLRVLLGVAVHATAGSPDLEAIRTRLLDEAGRRQLDIALHQLRDGELRADLPVLFGHQTADVQLRLRSDQEGGAAGAQRLVHVLSLRVTHPELGPVHIVARFRPGDLHVRVAVAHDAAKRALEPLQAEVTARLHGVGFPRVGVNIDLDPQAAAGPGEPDEEPPPPGGSILSALA
jgi:hypothetical protein